MLAVQIAILMRLARKWSFATFFGKMQQLRVQIKISSKMNTADIATKILPATTVSIFSPIVLGLQNTLPYRY
jgi:hypothetical protein